LLEKNVIRGTSEPTKVDGEWRKLLQEGLHIFTFTFSEEEN
jgi:hypothetical protein